MEVAWDFQPSGAAYQQIKRISAPGELPAAGGVPAVSAEVCGLLCIPRFMPGALKEVTMNDQTPISASGRSLGAREPSDPAGPRSHRGGPLVTGLRALFVIAVFLSVVRILDNEFGLAGAVNGLALGRSSE